MITPNLQQYFEGKRVLATGGSGFIGSHLVEMLVELGAKVTVPVRKTTSLAYLSNVAAEVAIEEADLFDRVQVDRVMKKGHDVVMHLAAAKGGGIAHSMDHHGSLFRDNMLSFINVLDSAREAVIPRVLVCSSACVYPRDARVPAPEEDGVRDAPEPTNAGYGWSKRMEEFMSLSYVQEFGMNIGIARPFNAYGPRDDFFNESNHVIPGLITRLLGGENPFTVWGSGRQTRSFVYATDFAQGLLMTCANEKVTGPLNIGSDEEISIAELAGMIVDLSGVNATIVLDPSKPDGQPRRACDTSRAKAELGFEAQVSFRDGLRQTIDWYVREKRFRESATDSPLAVL